MRDDDDDDDDDDGDDDDEQDEGRLWTQPNLFAFLRKSIMLCNKKNETIREQKTIRRALCVLLRKNARRERKKTHNHSMHTMSLTNDGFCLVQWPQEYNGKNNRVLMKENIVAQSYLQVNDLYRESTP